MVRVVSMEVAIFAGWAAIYRGPLMRDGEAAGVGSLQVSFMRTREIHVRQIQGIIKGHLYGTSGEFRGCSSSWPRSTVRRKRTRMRDGIDSAFGYRAKSGPSEEELDASLIGDRQAHVVLTKVFGELTWMGRN